MSATQKLLTLAGLGLVAFSMLYGFYYAVFDEHQTLEKIGFSMANGFAKAAEGDLAAAQTSLQAYAEIRIEYLREVHGHGHMAALGTLLILMGLFIDHVIRSQAKRLLISWMMVVGAVLLPLGAWLDVLVPAPVPKVLSVAGASCLVLGMVGVIFSLLFTATENND
ncbi:MAG: hypothetical protein ABW087_10940 [Candidatus Thiodiazotropha sp.]